MKEGLERFLSVSTKNNNRAYPADYLENGREIYDENKAKIALLKMQIERIRMQEEVDQNGGESGKWTQHCLSPFTSLLNRLGYRERSRRH